MKRLHLVLLFAVLLLPSLALAQGRATAVPAGLQPAWAGFSEAWRQNQFTALTPHLTPDFTLSAPGGSFAGSSGVADSWPVARSWAGFLNQPGSFITSGDRIVEIGRTQVASARYTWVPGDSGEMCAPEGEEFGQLQPLTYWREWVRGADGSWKVKSIVLH